MRLDKKIRNPVFFIHFACFLKLRTAYPPYIKLGSMVTMHKNEKSQKYICFGV